MLGAASYNHGSCDISLVDVLQYNRAECGSRSATVAPSPSIASTDRGGGILGIFADGRVILADGRGWREGNRRVLKNSKQYDISPK